MIDRLSPDLVSCTQAIYSHGGGKTRVLQFNEDGEIDRLISSEFMMLFYVCRRIKNQKKNWKNVSAVFLRSWHHYENNEEKSIGRCIDSRL